MIYNNALSDDIQDGGEYIRAMAYLMSWKGPVLEKDDPYGDGKTNKSSIAFNSFVVKIVL